MGRPKLKPEDRKPRKSRATGKPIGRPPKFSTPEEMQPLIDKYFTKCDEGRKYKFIFPKGAVVETLPISYTKEGLAHALGFDRRQTVSDYIKKAGFSFALSRAILKIAEQRMDLSLKKMIDPKMAQFDFINNQDGYVSQYNNSINIGIQVGQADQLNKGIARVAQIPAQIAERKGIKLLTPGLKAAQTRSERAAKAKEAADKLK